MYLLQFKFPSSVISKQSFLALKTLKTKMRSIMSNNWLNNFIHLHVYPGKITIKIHIYKTTNNIISGKDSRREQLSLLQISYKN